MDVFQCGYHQWMCEDVSRVEKNVLHYKKVKIYWKKYFVIAI